MDFTEILKFTGLDPALFGLSIVLAIILRYARGMIHWVGEKWTFGTALLLAAFGATIKMVDGEPWRVTAFNGVGLLAAVLILQFALQKWAEKTGAIPKDNEWLNHGGVK